MQADMARGAKNQTYMPHGYYALNGLLHTSSNQAEKFRVKNFLLTPQAFETLVQYCYFYVLGGKTVSRVKRNRFSVMAQYEYSICSSD